MDVAELARVWNLRARPKSGDFGYNFSKNRMVISDGRLARDRV